MQGHKPAVSNPRIAFSQLEAQQDSIFLGVAIVVAALEQVPRLALPPAAALAETDSFALAAVYPPEQVNHLPVTHLVPIWIRELVYPLASSAVCIPEVYVPSVLSNHPAV